jgi:Flp pilus assembly pilin Flp
LLADSGSCGFDDVRFPTMRCPEDTLNQLPEEVGACACWRDQDGQVLVEYACILILVSIAALALTPVGQTLAGLFAALAADIVAPL